MNERTHTPILIVGAGITGLLAAHTLREAGFEALVVERADTVGGRLATCAVGPGRADYGAQFFTVRTPEFQAHVDRWRDADLAFEWAHGWSDGSLAVTRADGHPRYAIRGGMQALAQHLAAPLDVRTGANLTAVARHYEGWVTVDDQGRVYTADAVLLTPPVPLALSLLRAGDVPLHDDTEKTLRAIQYDPSLTGLYWINGPVHLPEPGAIQQHNAAIAWVADNKRKGISPDATIITIQAGPGYSAELWPLADWEILVALSSALRRYKDLLADVVEQQLIRWPYAMPQTVYPQRYLRLDNLPPLLLAGDAFGGPRVEGAVLSGMVAAAAIIGALKTVE